MARAAGGTAKTGVDNALGISEAASRGRAAAWDALNGGGRSSSSAAGQSALDSAPAWATRLRSEQTARHIRQVALQTLKEGDRGGASAAPDIKERED